MKDIIETNDGHIEEIKPRKTCMTCLCTFDIKRINLLV